MKPLARPLRPVAVLLCLAFITAILFFSLQACVNDDDMFYGLYASIGQAAGMGMTTGELTRASSQMIDYMEGRADSIDIDVTVNGEIVSMFNERERAHMVDVKVLYQNWRTASWVMLAAYILFAAALAFVYRRAAICMLARAYLWAGGLFLLLLLALTAFATLDFNAFWTYFHLVFFNNDLWLFDLATSRMINMMPSELFYGIILRMVELFLVFFLGLFALAFVFNARFFRRRLGAA
ncbi:MAG: TIGR01906 family membrane protein [Clostridiales bacterium]|jgi:integral membrane protein (TIGR01906 family)|nr:TIGR01906 family membrane protein [Clostridiales bacterium]